MVGIVRDDDKEKVARLRRGRGRRLDDRVRPEEQGGARVRHHRPARDVRDRSRRPGRGGAVLRGDGRQPGADVARGAGHALMRRVAARGSRSRVIVVTALVVLVVRSQPSRLGPKHAPRRLERELACPVCTGESVAESNAPEARAIRDDIRDRIDDGQSDGEIVDAYVERVRRAHPAEPRRRRPRARRVGPAGRRGDRGRGRHRRRAAALEPRAAPRGDRGRRSARRPSTRDRNCTRNMSDQTALEAERDFLLRSLDDLESERDAGNIDDETYRTLHEDYTARAAVVIRSLRDDVAPALPEAPRASRRAKVVTDRAARRVRRRAAFGLDARARARARRARRSPATRQRRAPTRRRGGARAARRRPPRPSPTTTTRASPTRALLLGSDLATALREFDAAAQHRPEPARAADVHRLDQRAGRTRRAIPAPTATRSSARAQESLDQAIALDPNYTDAYVYRALFNSTVLERPGRRRPRLPEVPRPRAAPTTRCARSVNGALADAVAASGSSTTTVTTP